jgi:hypothetical protein
MVLAAYVGRTGDVAMGKDDGQVDRQQGLGAVEHRILPAPDGPMT